MEGIVSRLNAIATLCGALSGDIALVNEEHGIMKERLEKEKAVIATFNSPVQLNVGGTLFTTSIDTLQKVPDTLFSAMFSGRHKMEATKDGSYFIDRDGTHFRWILNFLRDPTSIDILNDPTTLAEVFLEAKYYCIVPLVMVIEKRPCCKKYRTRTAVTSAWHISNKDTYSPTESALQSPTLQVTLLERTVDWGNLTTTCDAILVTAWSSIDMAAYGNFLANFVDRGGNVVLCLFSNTTSYTYPQGRFLAEHYHPLVPVSVLNDGAGKTLGRVYNTDHPIMQGVTRVILGSEVRRLVTTLTTVGTVERIADWSDGHPMVATRTDKRGLVTSISFSMGGNGGKEDALRMVQNALALQRI